MKKEKNIKNYLENQAPEMAAENQYIEKQKKNKELKELAKIYKELYQMFSNAELTWSIQGLCEGISKAYTEYKLKQLIKQEINIKRDNN